MQDTEPDPISLERRMSLAVKRKLDPAPLITGDASLPAEVNLGLSTGDVKGHGEAATSIVHLEIGNTRGDGRPILIADRRIHAA